MGILAGWADFIFLWGNVVFFLALLPAILKRKGPPASTCLLTAAVLTLYAATFASLGLWKSAAGGVLAAAEWWALLAQAQSIELVLTKPAFGVRVGKRFIGMVRM